MSKTQQWVIGAVLAIVLVMAAGWFLLVNPQHAKAAKLRSQTAAAQTGTAALRTQLDVLTAQAKLLPAKRAELAKFAVQIPPTASLPAIVRALQVAADKAGVSLPSITPSTPIAYVPAQGAALPVPAASGAAAAKVPTATVPVASSSLQSLTVTTRVIGSYVELEQFFTNIEGQTRLWLITGYSMAPDGATTCSAKSCLISVDLTVQLFLAPAVAAAPAPLPAIPTTVK